MEEELRELKEYLDHLSETEINTLTELLDEMISGNMENYYKESNIRVTYTLDLLTNDIIFDEESERYIINKRLGKIGIDCYDKINDIKFSSELVINPKTGQQLVIYSEGNDFLESYEFPNEIIMNWCPVSKYEVIT